VLVVLTWLFACGALESQRIAADADGNDISYPLAEIIGDIPAGQSLLLLYGFGIIALFGLIASYHGMLYATSRQAFALGRAGYLPRLLGEVHATRRTPVLALLVCSLVAAGFIVANIWYASAIAVAVLVSTLTALIWYILAMLCLYLLRRREPQLFTAYRAPVYRLLPAGVIILSAFAIFAYARTDYALVLMLLAAALYAVGIGYYLLWGRHRLQRAAPEELVARHARTTEKGKVV
jgi:ethanolamine permease